MKKTEEQLTNGYPHCINIFLHLIRIMRLLIVISIGCLTSQMNLTSYLTLTLETFFYSGLIAPLEQPHARQLIPILIILPWSSEKKMITPQSATLKQFQVESTCAHGKDQRGKLEGTNSMKRSVGGELNLIAIHNSLP